MYLPKHFEEPNLETIHKLIRDYPFAALVSHGANGFEVNHIPFLFDPAAGPHGTLRAHVARNSDAWRALQANPEALVIFSGPHAYVSPSSYPSKQAHGKAVPTWNYFVAHAHGRVQVFEDAAWLLRFVTDLTNRFEGERREPWKVSDAPADFTQSLMNAIVGLEMPIEKLVAKRKASQNRDEADRWGVVEDLRSRGEDAMADAMDA